MILKIIKTAFVQEADRTLKELKRHTLRLSTEDKDAMRVNLQKMIDDSERNSKVHFSSAVSML